MNSHWIFCSVLDVLCTFIFLYDNMVILLLLSFFLSLQDRTHIHYNLYWSVEVNITHSFNTLSNAMTLCDYVGNFFNKINVYNMLNGFSSIFTGINSYRQNIIDEMPSILVFLFYLHFDSVTSCVQSTELIFLQNEIKKTFWKTDN